MISAFLILSTLTVQEVPATKRQASPPIVLTEEQRLSLVSNIAKLDAEINFLEQQVIFWKLEAAKNKKDCGI